MLDFYLYGKCLHLGITYFFSKSKVKDLPLPILVAISYGRESESEEGSC